MAFQIFYMPLHPGLFLPFLFVLMKRQDEIMGSDYISLSNNYKFKRFTIGYGLSYAKNNWELKEPHQIKNNFALGLVFPTYF